MHDPQTLPDGLPVPTDDGGASHLLHAAVADVSLVCTSGETVRLRTVCERPTVLFFFPRTGVPGQPPGPGFEGESWDQIPGARGCTPQSCGFRDLYEQIAATGVQLLGLSTQTSEFQSEFKRRNRVTFDYLSDSDLRLATAMRLPIFEFPIASGGPNRLFKRMAWFVDQNQIQHLWYPVFPPDQNAAQVLGWLTTTRRRASPTPCRD